MATDDERLPSGTLFADFEVVSLLGEGGFGAVYRAQHVETGREVALKVLRAEVADNAEVVQRFFREADAVAQLRHPNIVEAVSMGNDPRPFLAMELLHGEPLTAMMNREGALPLQRALDVLIPVMSAMRSVHEQGIVHRDLKPDNIFIVYTSGYGVHPKVLDFGFVKFDDSRTRITRNDTTIGTPNFMSPEQLHSPQQVDNRSDVWALGVLLYYALTNVKPFAAPTLVHTLKNVLHGEPRPLRELRPDLPPEVEAIVHRALSKDKHARFRTVHEMAQALLPYVSDETALVYASEFYAESVWDDPTGLAPQYDLEVGDGTDDTHPHYLLEELDEPPDAYVGQYEPPTTPEFARPDLAAPTGVAPDVHAVPRHDVVRSEQPYALPEVSPSYPPHSLVPTERGFPPQPRGTRDWIAIAAAAVVAVGLVAGAWAFTRASDTTRATTTEPPMALHAADAATDAPDGAHTP